MEQSNFDFLQEHDPLFYQLAHSAELYFSRDPNTALIKLRQFGEAIAQNLAVRYHIDLEYHMSQVDLINAIDQASDLDPTIRSLFHQLRIKGNRATHEFETKHQSAMEALRIARQLAIWYHRAFGKDAAHFTPSEFIPPKDPSQSLNALQREINRLQNEIRAKENNLDDQQKALASSAELAKLHQKEKAEYQRIAEMMDDVAREQEEGFKVQRLDYERRLKRLEGELADQNSDERRHYRQILTEQLLASTAQIDLDETDVRIIIDQQLRESGWQVDSKQESYHAGVRPEVGKNRAIANWPLEGRSIDYLLFYGLTPIGIIEAKRENIDVAGKIDEATRYASQLVIDNRMEAPWDQSCRSLPWRNGEEIYTIPFVYSANGRPFINYPERSGIWFQDLRKPSNLARPLHGFHSPNGLMELLKHNCQLADDALEEADFNALELRDYQIEAIQTIEAELVNNQRKQLVTMAPGTGKTRTIFALIYRLLKTKRFQHILLLVDRTALGMQILNHLDAMDRQIGTSAGASLTALYQIGYLPLDQGSEAPLNKEFGADHIQKNLTMATLESVMEHLKGDDHQLAIDHFDCVIMDEFHSATIPLKESESAYQRIVDYFDATMIGFSANHTAHLDQLLAEPSYQYPFSQAVIDGWLIDYEPPVLYETKLSQTGIYFGAGAKVDYYHHDKNELERFDLTEELHFGLSDFNDRVINEAFNEVICQRLVNLELDPFGTMKTLIFCQNDRHADMVKRLLDEAFVVLYGDHYNRRMTAKITHKSDNPDQLIQQFREETYPNIAVTVDILSVEIEIPAINNIVFLRHIESPILYERMIGRASRPAPECHKKSFRIYNIVRNDEIQSSVDSTIDSPIPADCAVISRHKDEFVAEQQPIHGFDSVNDYLESFYAWIDQTKRENSTLATLLDDPRMVTRREYHHLKRLAYEAGFSDLNLQTAYHRLEKRSVDATLIGFIRHAVFNEPLISFNERVKRAMERIEATQLWSSVQQQWLKRIEEYLIQKEIIDQNAIDQFAEAHGGYERLDQILEQNLHTILRTIDDALWSILEMPIIDVKAKVSLIANQNEQRESDSLADVSHENNNRAKESSINQGNLESPHSAEELAHYRKIGIMTLMIFGVIMAGMLIASFM